MVLPVNYCIHLVEIFIIIYFYFNWLMALKQVINFLS